MEDIKNITYNLESNHISTLTDLTVLGILRNSESAYETVGKDYVKKKFVPNLYKVHAQYFEDDTVVTQEHNNSIVIFYAESLEELYMQIIKYENFNNSLGGYLVIEYISTDIFRNELYIQINDKWITEWENYFDVGCCMEKKTEFWNKHKNDPEFINIQLEYVKRCHENNEKIYITECKINNIY